MDHFEELGWSKAQEEARLERWAKQVLTCPHRICRRAAGCKRGMPKAVCPSEPTEKMSWEEDSYLTLQFRRDLERVMETSAAGRDIDDEYQREIREDKRMRRLALKRVRTALRQARARQPG